MLALNKWRRVCPGVYRLGDITVEQIWHSSGPCAGNNMWHVIVGGKTLITWAYLRDAKQFAHKTDRHVEAREEER